MDTGLIDGLPSNTVKAAPRRRHPLLCHGSDDFSRIARLLGGAATAPVSPLHTKILIVSHFWTRESKSGMIKLSATFEGKFRIECAVHFLNSFPECPYISGAMAPHKGGRRPVRMLPNLTLGPPFAPVRSLAALAIWLPWITFR